MCPGIGTTCILLLQANNFLKMNYIMVSWFGFLCCDKTLWIKAPWGRKVGSQGRTLGRHLEYKPWRSTAYWLVQVHSHLCFLYCPGHMPSGWYHLQWAGPPKSISNQEKAPQMCSQANPMKAVPEWRFPFPRYVKWTTKISHHRRVWPKKLAVDP